MKSLKAYTINFVSLADGTHSFDYQLDKKFLANFEDAMVKVAKIKATLEMHKMVHCLELNFHIKGKVQTPCDICAEDFDLPIEGEETIVVKLVEEIPKENDELNVVYMHQSTHSVNVATMLYELIMLSIPMRKIHPLDENDERTCNTKVLEYLEESEENLTHTDEDEDSTNPIWDELKKLKKE